MDGLGGHGLGWTAMVLQLMLAWGLVATEDKKMILYTVHLKEIPLIH